MANPWAWYYYDIKGFKDANTGTASVEDIGAEKILERTFRVYGNGPTPHLLSLLVPGRGASASACGKG